MRSALLLPLLLVASCAGRPDNAFSSSPPGLDIADVALANGSPSMALHVAQQMLANDPHNLAALARAADAQAALGQRDQAMRTYGQALAVAPDNGAALLGMGRLELATDPAIAAEMLTRLTQAEPANVAGLVDLGIASDLLGRHETAQRAYRQALTLDPARTAARVNLGLSLALSGDAPQALEILRPIAQQDAASPRVRQDLAAALVLAGDTDAAATLLHQDMQQPQVLETIAGYRSLQAAK